MRWTRTLSAEEQRHLARIKALYDPATLAALDVRPVPTVIQHIWFLLALLDLEAIAQERERPSP